MPFANLEKTSADPAAGGEIEFTADEDMIVHSCYFEMVTSAVAANRVVTLAADDGTDIFFRSRGGTNHPASNTRIYSAFGGAPTGENGMVNLALPAGGLRLRKGDRLRTITQLKDVGDNFGAMTLQVERI